MVTVHIHSKCAQKAFLLSFSQRSVNIYSEVKASYDKYEAAGYCRLEYIFPLFMLLPLASNLTYRHERGINLLIQLLARKRMNEDGGRSGAKTNAIRELIN